MSLIKLAKLVLRLAATLWTFSSVPAFGANQLGKNLRPPAQSRLISLTAKSEGTAAKDLFKPGQVVVIDFWASWCQRCKENLKKLDPLVKKWGKNPQFRFYAVSIDDSLEEAKSIFANHTARRLTNIKSHTFLDQDGTLSGAWVPEGVPYLMVLDAKNKVIFEHEGILTNEDLSAFAKFAEPLTKADH